MMLDEGRLDHDIAEIFLDAVVALQHAFDDRLIMGHAARHEFQQIVVAAADQMAFDDFVQLADTRLEPGKVAGAMFGQRHFGKDGQIFAQLVQVDVRTIAGDVAGLFQPLHPRQAGAGRQTDRVGQFDISDAA